jgi:methanethiol S-methyltransferase
MKGWLEVKLKRHYIYYRLYYTLFAFIGLVLIILYLLGMQSFYLFRPGVITYIPGGIIAIAGITVMGICIRKYFAHLSGIRSLYMIKKNQNELMITGIHKYIRHPLYAGTFLFIWGVWLFIPFLSLLITNLIITIYTLLGISWEEQKLESEFGESYKRYKLQVPKLIPLFKSRMDQ